MLKRGWRAWNRPAEWPWIPAGSNVDALCEHLGMAEDAVVIMVNDVQHHRGTVLNAGDAVTFLPSLVVGEPVVA